MIDQHDLQDKLAAARNEIESLHDVMEDAATMIEKNGKHKFYRTSAVNQLRKAVEAGNADVEFWRGWIHQYNRERGQR